MARKGAEKKRRPDYVKCIKRGDIGKQTWCGRKPVTFVFEEAGHAALHIRSGGRYLLCPNCASKLISVLHEGTYSPDTPEVQDYGPTGSPEFGADSEAAFRADYAYGEDSA